MIIRNVILSLFEGPRLARKDELVCGQVSWPLDIDSDNLRFFRTSCHELVCRSAALMHPEEI